MRALKRLFVMSAAVCMSGCAIAPVPVTPQVLDWHASLNMSAVDAGQEPITGPVSIDEAMARALKYNLDYRVQMAETALKAAELDLAHFNLLPNAVANTGYAGRDSYSASSSLNLETNQPNFGASTSQDKRTRASDLTFSWNILDFGLSYVRAEQSADRVLISEEMQRSVTHRLMEDVRTAFWRAVSYERLIARMQRLESRAKAAISESRALAKNQETSPITALTSERELIEIKRSIKELQRELVAAKAQLAALMNVRPDTPFALDTRVRPKTPPGLPMTLHELMDVAVRNRPELRENIYQQRINLNEADAALLELLPGVQLYTGPEMDTNSFLLHNDWVSWGAKASWNLLKVFQYPAKREVIEAQDGVLKMRALALTMAVMMQTNVSALRFRHAQEELAVASEQRSVQKRLSDQIHAETEAGRVSEHVELREELNTLVAEAKYDIAYAGLESAYANLLTTIGEEPYGIAGDSVSIAQITRMLSKGRLALGTAPAGQPAGVAETSRDREEQVASTAH